MFDRAGDGQADLLLYLQSRRVRARTPVLAIPAKDVFSRFVVANPDRAYATCVPNHQMYLGSHPAQAHGITNQSPPKLIVETAEDENNPKHNLRRERKRPQLLRRTTGRRLRKSAELGSGPAVALLEHAGEDPWALVSK